MITFSRTAVSAHTLLVLSASTVSTSAVNASERRAPTLVSARYVMSCVQARLGERTREWEDKRMGREASFYDPYRIDAENSSILIGRGIPGGLRAPSKNNTLTMSLQHR
jgi:hypothetical protein